MKKILFAMMALFATCTMSAQDAPTKIITGHPDFKVQVKRCAASGTTMVVDLVLSNEGTKDIDDIVLVGSAWDRSEAYDDEGNMYKEQNGTNIKIKVSNMKEYESRESRFRLLTDVPMRVSVRIEGFSATAERIALLKIGVQCRQWGLVEGKQITIRNIPISRD